MGRRSEMSIWCCRRSGAFSNEAAMPRQTIILLLRRFPDLLRRQWAERFQSPVEVPPVAQGGAVAALGEEGAIADRARFVRLVADDGVELIEHPGGDAVAVGGVDI